MPVQYQIEGSSSASIAESIEKAIDEGQLATGQLLPAIRDLSTALGVSTGTVAAAYRLAQLRGLTVADRRRGTRVRARSAEHTSTRANPALPAIFEGLLDLASGNPDPELLPDLPEAVSRLSYRPVLYGAAPLASRLQKVAADALTADGISPAAMTCTFGALDGAQRVFGEMLRFGDRVALEDPGWPALASGIARWGYRPVPVAIDHHGPLPESLWAALAAGAKAVVVTARAQNPTGAAINVDRRTELVSVLARYPGTLLIEDDHGHDIVSGSHRLHPLCAGDGAAASGPFVFIRSASKAHGPDLRCAVMAGDPTTISRVEATIAASAGHVSHLLQELVAELWSDEEHGLTTEKVARTYDERRAALLTALASTGMEIEAPTGLNVWIPVADEHAAVASLAETGIAVAPGAGFRLVSGPGIRVTTATLPTEGAAAIAKAVAEAAGARHCGNDGPRY